MTEDIRIVLVGAAKEAHDKMLNEIRSDEKTSITSSKLINWIVSDYFQNYFDKRRNKICKAHFNSRKFMRAVLKENDPQSMKRALRELTKNLSSEKEDQDSKVENEPA
jgi:hypothetical protein